MKCKQTAAATVRFRRSKPERELFAAVGMRQRRLVAQGHELLPQLEPAAQMCGRMGRASRPADPDERSPDIEVGRVLPDFEKSNARSFREGQFEIACFG